MALIIKFIRTRPDGADSYKSLIFNNLQYLIAQHIIIVINNLKNRIS